MTSKYKVMADKQFLGHYHARNGRDAVARAVRVNFVYHPKTIGAENCMFIVQKNGNKDYYSWSSMPELAKEFKVPVGDAM